nr:alcohol dehydrogenase catalytic domain-containing protein [Nesterenkonia salmonea]
MIPDHQVVGTVAAVGDAAFQHDLGDRVGVAWLRSTCGSCRWCREGPRSSGWPLNCDSLPELLVILSLNW